MAVQTVEAPEARREPGVSRHARLVRVQERIAKGFIWSAAGITILVLALIVGYIVVNGFYTRTTSTEPTFPYAQERIDVGQGGASFAVLAPGDLRLRSLQYDELREIFLGLNPYLGYLTGQDRNASPLILGESGFVSDVESYLTGEGMALPDAVERLPDRSAIEAALESREGALAIVPAAWLEELNVGQAVPVHEVTVAVHPAITELQAGRRLNHLEPEQVRALLTGEAEAWAQVGGPGIEIEAADLSAGDEGEYEPLPVRPILFTEPARELAGKQQALLQEILPDIGAPESGSATAVSVSSVTAFAEAIRTTPGAVGIVSRDVARAQELPVIEVEHVESSANLRPSFFVTPPRRAGAVGGASTIILNTLAMIAFVLLIATPIGVAGAIYLVEYAKQGRLLTILRIGTDTLAGIPSIVFGLFGLVFFAQFLGFQTGMISGTLTLTLMILPTVVRTSEEALRAVPKEIREGSLALGATKLQTIFRVVLPSAAPGILTGMILGIGRAVGETAALLYTMGSNLALLRSLNSPIRVLSVHLYLLVRETISLPNAFAAATILVIIVIIVNYLTRSLIGRMTRMASQQ